ncbi:MAG: hypothetical protein DBY44_00205 [Veillonellaceae bacterium]|nr:MAG: hypothetical protein DBY44_00205 [Veillonellaceae bacterium]
MIKLGELLKIIDLDGPTLNVYIDVSADRARAIDEDDLSDYYDREVLNILFNTVDADDCDSEYFVGIAITGPYIPYDDEEPERTVYID